jgi:uncharacterized protein
MDKRAMERAEDDGFSSASCRAARALLGISQGELAARAGVSRLTVAGFESGVRQPIPTTRRALRSVLESAGVAVVAGGAVLGSLDPGAGAPPGQRLAAAIRALQAQAARLRRMGVRHLAIFGSTARGEDQRGSDLDLLVTLDRRREIDVFDFAAIREEIQRILPWPVDVTRREALAPEIRRAAEGDEVDVF